MNSQQMPANNQRGGCVHLVDGTFELFRSFYGAPSATGPDGREVGAVRGLLRSFAALVARPEVTHVACAFDHVIESFRNDLFDGYKTGAGIDPDLWGQAELAERAAEALGIVVWPMIEFEADDALATAALRFAALDEVARVVICSPDKDLAQCTVEPKVVLWDRIRDRELDADRVRAKFGVSPESIPDYLALVGDTADGIPGIRRWGAKSAAAVLAHYAHIEQIPEDATRWEVSVRGAKALAQELSDNRRDALLYRRLATLRTDVPLQEDLDALRVRGIDDSKLVALCEEIGDDRFLARMRPSSHAGRS